MLDLRRVSAALIGLAVVSLYLAMTGGHFLSDDWGLFPEIRTFASVPADFTRPWLDRTDCFYRPLATLSLAVDYFFWRLDPVPYHVTNLLIFVACAVVVSRLALRLSPSRAPIAGFAAFLFCLLHPVAVEPATWVCCRGTLLSGLLVLVGWLAYLKWMERGRAGDLLLVLVAEVGALLSKEDALTFPAIALVLGVSRRHRRRSGLGLLATGIPVALYFGVRSLFAIHFPGGGHGALLAPARWGDAIRGMAGHLGRLFVPCLEPGPSPAFLATVACGAGLAVLLIANGTALFRRGVARAALAVGLAVVPALPLLVTLTHGTRTLFQPLLLASVLVGVLASERWKRLGAWVSTLAVGLISCGLIALTALTLVPWREAGALSMRIAAELDRLHRQVPIEEPFIFTDPPRYHRTIPVVDMGVDSILQPPFTARPRPLMSAFRDMAIRVVNRAPVSEDETAPQRVLIWRNDLGLLDAPAPLKVSTILCGWRGEDVVRPREDGKRGCTIRTPDLGLSPLVMNRLEVLLKGGRFEGRGVLEIEGMPRPEGRPLRVPLALRAERVDRPGHVRLWVAIADLEAVKPVVRVDRIALQVEDLAPDSVVEVSILRELPTFGLEATMKPADASPEGDVRLVLRMKGVADPAFSVFRVRFYHVRDELHVLDLPLEALKRMENADLVFEAALRREQLRRLGLIGGPELFVRVEAYAGKADPMQLRARSEVAWLRRK
jgi:hypothetical protein